MTINFDGIAIDGGERVKVIGEVLLDVVFGTLTFMAKAE